MDREVLEATDRALAAHPAPADSVYEFVYSPDIDPAGAKFEVAPKFAGQSAGGTIAKSKTMVEIISATLADEMVAR